MNTGMTVAILGASNSIIAERGFVRALETRHRVINLSGGDVPMTFLLTQALDNAATIAGADVVILDHSISDRLFYAHKLGQTYLDDVEEAYHVLSAINPNLISIVFPLRVHREIDAPYRDRLRAICTSLQARVIDLQPLADVPSVFEDDMHVHTEVSYLLGDFLNDLIADLPRRPVTHPEVRHPFAVVPAAAIAPDTPVETFRGALYDQSCVPLHTAAEIAFETQQRLVSIQYVVPKGQSRYAAAEINGARHYFGGLYATGEIALRPSATRFRFSPVTGNEPLRLPHLPWWVERPYAPLNLVSATFRSAQAAAFRVSGPAPEPNATVPCDVDIGPLRRALDRLERSGWHDHVAPLSEEARRVVEALTSMPLAERNRFVGETFEKGRALRRMRFDRFRAFYTVPARRRPASGAHARQP